MRKLATENENITVTYNYPQKEYTITNKVLGKESLTKRQQAIDTLNVLKVLIPTTAITEQSLIQLATYVEQISSTSISYTYDPTYFYINSFYFNDYEEYKLQVNPSKAIILISNSNLIFDLTLSESLADRLSQIKSFYYNKLKLELSIPILQKLYETLLESYKPQVVNQITEATNTITSERQLQYTATAFLNDFSKEALTNYSLTKSTVSSSTLNKIASIYKVDNTNNIVHLLQEPSREVKVGDTVQLFNTNNTILRQEFSDDGSYIVKSIISDTAFQIEGLLPITYTTPTPIFYALYSNMGISSSSTTENTIVVTKDIENELSIGDEIQVVNTTIIGEFGSSTSIDGTYTVKEINGSTIYVNEAVASNYNYSSSYEKQGMLFKKVSLGKVEAISSQDSYSIVSLVDEPSFTLRANDLCAILYIGDEFKLCRVHSSSSTPSKVNVEDYDTPNTPVESFKAVYGELRTDFLGEAISLEVTKSSNEEVLPIGEFTLLNSNQCSNYLGLIPNNALPSTKVYENLGKVVESYKSIIIGATEYQVQMKGLAE